MEATDVYIDTREAHRALVERLNAEYQAETPMGYPEAGYAAYKKSQATLEQANQALAQAETALKQQEPLMRKEIVQNLATDVASDLGVDPRLIDVVDEAPHPFTVGDKQFTEAGHYDPTTKRIQLNSNNISYANAPGVKGVVAHATGGPDRTAGSGEVSGISRSGIPSGASRRRRGRMAVEG